MSLPTLLADENIKIKPLCINRVHFYRLKTLPVIQATVSKHWRDLKALKPTFLYPPTHIKPPSCLLSSASTQLST